jgi:modulator of FtsH protease
MYPASRDPSVMGYGLSVSTGERLAFLRKVYGLMTASVAVSALSAMFALTFGAGRGEIPPLVALVGGSPFIAFLAILGGAYAASALARKPGINVAVLFGFAALLGFFIAPAVFVAQARASQGAALTAAPVLHAFLLAVAEFVGLTTYVFVSKRDFSAIGGFLTMGLFVVLGASLLSFFFGGAVFSLAIASVVVLLFGGFVLYDTSRILRSGDLEPVPAALGLYLNFFNIFMALLRIFSGGRRS